MIIIIAVVQKKFLKFISAYRFCRHFSGQLQRSVQSYERERERESLFNIAFAHKRNDHINNTQKKHL